MLELLAQHLGGTIVQARVINELRDNLSEQNRLVARQREKMLEYEQAEERAAREGAPREKFVDIEAMIRARG